MLTRFLLRRDILRPVERLPATLCFEYQIVAPEHISSSAARESSSVVLTGIISYHRVALRYVGRDHIARVYH